MTERLQGKGGVGSVLEAVKVGLLVFIAVALVGGLGSAFWYMRFLTRQIVAEVHAAGLVRAALDYDEFGPPPAASAAVQGGRHRGLHLVGARGPVTRFVMQRLFVAG